MSSHKWLRQFEIPIWLVGASTMIVLLFFPFSPFWYWTFLEIRGASRAIFWLGEKAPEKQVSELEWNCHPDYHCSLGTWVLSSFLSPLGSRHEKWPATWCQDSQVLDMDFIYYLEDRLAMIPKYRIWSMNLSLSFISRNWDREGEVLLEEKRRRKTLWASKVHGMKCRSHFAALQFREQNLCSNSCRQDALLELP